MGLPLERLKAEVLDLPGHERARLAHRLLVGLDDDRGEDPAEVERGWEEEIRRRLAEYRAGKVQPIPAAEVFAEAARAASMMSGAPLLPAAPEEFLQTADRYHAQTPGLGEELIAAVSKS